ncbi:MAG: SUMF1/EgtB/PvdO family nonheme iron enzyme [Rubripirellula sp.]|nr:SUMF1/EgtB/PvdO family nonheme iron enzyme [Rubripirellula sp.]
MPDDFDPYHAWLGVPPKEQPCTHYRLLGLTIFEAEQDVIDAAAARQIAHVRTYQLKHPDEATRILRELVEAKSCLVNPERKAAYDQTLVETAAVNQVPAPPVETAPIESDPAPSDPVPSDSAIRQPRLRIQVQGDQESHRNTLNRRPKTNASATWLPKAFGGLGGISIAILLWWIIAGGDRSNFVTPSQIAVTSQDDKNSAASTHNEMPAAQDSGQDRVGKRTEINKPAGEIPESPSSEIVEVNSNDPNLDPSPVRSALNGSPPPLAIAPFNPAEAKAQQQAWSEYLNVPIEYTNDIGMKFTLIPPGEFLMGCTAAQNKLLLDYASRQISRPILFDSYQKNVIAISPQRKVRITRPFYLSVRETTVGQFEKITKNQQTANNTPARQITWNQATQFCQQLNEGASRESTYRLPTSAEWEMACRAGSLGLHYFENSGDPPNTNGEALAAKPSNEGPQAINPWGLRDMYGSLGEWTSDWWESPDATAGFDPAGPDSGDERVIRGSGWNNRAVSSTSVERSGGAPTTASTNIGFRVVLEISGEIPDASDNPNRLAANPATEPNPAKLPIPEKERLDSALIKFNQTFSSRKETVDKLRWPEQSTAFQDLAREVHELYEAESDITLKYLILERSVQWAIESADADLTEQHIAAFEQTFQIDGLAYRSDAASRWADISKTHYRGSQLIAARNRIVEWTVPLAKRFEQKERFDEAISLLNLASSLVGGSRDRQRMLRVLSRQIKTKSEQRAAILALEESVKQTPDAAKFSELGQYWCFDIGNWDRGLKYLAQGDDPTFSSAAKLDLETEEMGALQLPVAEAWYQIALKLKDDQQRHVAMRARGLLERSQASLQGIELKQAESQLEKLVEMTVGGATPAIAPFPANVAQDQQRAWAQSLNLPIEFTNSIGMTFVLIPPGDFTMGYNEPQTNFFPAHRVRLTRPYYLGKTELTVDQYNSLAKKQLINGVGSRPQIQNWTEATAFCEALTTYEKGQLYRLPTEAEWEFAHRAGRMDLPEPQQVQLALASGWYKSNSGGTLQPAAKKPANAWGLHDMFGNAGEWVHDLPYVFPMVPTRVDPRSPPDVSTATNSFKARGLPSPDGTRRITRGGSFNREVFDNRVVKWYRYTTRHSGFQSSDYGCTGARILLEIDVAAKPAQP